MWRARTSAGSLPSNAAAERRAPSSSALRGEHLREIVEHGLHLRLRRGGICRARERARASRRGGRRRGRGWRRRGEDAARVGRAPRTRAPHIGRRRGHRRGAARASRRRRPWSPASRTSRRHSQRRAHRRRRGGERRRRRLARAASVSPRRSRSAPTVSRRSRRRAGRATRGARRRTSGSAWDRQPTTSALNRSGGSRTMTPSAASRTPARGWETWAASALACRTRAWARGVRGEVGRPLAHVVVGVGEATSEQRAACASSASGGSSEMTSSARCRTTEWSSSRRAATARRIGAEATVEAGPRRAQAAPIDIRAGSQSPREPARPAASAAASRTDVVEPLQVVAPIAGGTQSMFAESMNLAHGLHGRMAAQRCPAEALAPISSESGSTRLIGRGLGTRVAGPPPRPTTAASPWRRRTRCLRESVLVHAELLACAAQPAARRRIVCARGRTPALAALEHELARCARA